MARSILPTISANSDLVRSSNVDIKQRAMNTTESDKLALSDVRHIIDQIANERDRLREAPRGGLEMTRTWTRGDEKRWAALCMAVTHKRLSPGNWIEFKRLSNRRRETPAHLWYNRIRK